MTDTYAIYQLKETPENHLLRFASLAELRGRPVEKDRYDLIYSGLLTDAETKAPAAILEDLYAQFNLYRPEDFHGHSLSVSDVIVLNRDGKAESYYTDSYGFVPLSHFLLDNPLRNAEMAMEDDFNMIDGIINNGPKHELVLPEHPKRSAVPER